MLALGPFSERVKDRKKNGGEEGGQGAVGSAGGELELVGVQSEAQQEGCNTGKL